jgi:hypothetical protein
MTARQRIAILTNPCAGIAVGLNFAANAGSGFYCLNGAKFPAPSIIPNWAFTRASAATALTSSGKMVTFASGAPRITDLGYLSEASATNLAIQSSALANAAWTVSSGALSTDGTLAPDGSTAQLYTAAVANTFHELFTTAQIAGTFTSSYASSVFVKPGTSRYMFLTLTGSSAGNYATAVFDVGTGASGVATQTAVGITSGAVTSGTDAYIGNGWYRLQLVSASIQASNATLAFGVASGATGNTIGTFGTVSFSAAGTETAYFFAPQVETGSMATSWVSTTASTGTRLADTMKITGLSGIGSGSFAAVFRSTLPIGDAITRVLGEFSDGSASNRYDIRRSSTNTAQFIASTSAANTTYDQVSGETGTISLNMAALIAAANYQPAVNGSLGALQTYARPSGLNELDIGMTAAGVGQCNCYISKASILASTTNVQSATQ